MQPGEAVDASLPVELQWLAAAKQGNLDLLRKLFASKSEPSQPLGMRTNADTPLSTANAAHIWCETKPNLILVDSGQTGQPGPIKKALCFEE